MTQVQHEPESLRVNVAFGGCCHFTRTLATFHQPPGSLPFKKADSCFLSSLLPNFISRPASRPKALRSSPLFFSRRGHRLLRGRLRLAQRLGAAGGLRSRDAAGGAGGGDGRGAAAGAGGGDGLGGGWGGGVVFLGLPGDTREKGGVFSTQNDLNAPK